MCTLTIKRDCPRAIPNQERARLFTSILLFSFPSSFLFSLPSFIIIPPPHHTCFHLLFPSPSSSSSSTQTCQPDLPHGGSHSELGHPPDRRHVCLGHVLASGLRHGHFCFVFFCFGVSHSSCFCFGLYFSWRPSLLEPLLFGALSTGTVSSETVAINPVSLPLTETQGHQPLLSIPVFGLPTPCTSALGKFQPAVAFSEAPLDGPFPLSSHGPSRFGSLDHDASALASSVIESIEHQDMTHEAQQLIQSDGPADDGPDMMDTPSVGNHVLRNPSVRNDRTSNSISALTPCSL